MSISVDPLFFYIPVINEELKCLSLNRNLKITACVLRTFFDLIYILHIIFQFGTRFILPSTNVPRTGVLIGNISTIVRRYLGSHFIIDILSIIPLPQMVTLAIIPIPNCSVPYVAKNLLKYTIIVQYVPRVLRLYLLFKEVTRTYGIMTKTAWSGAAFNLFIYMLASHGIGAFWYLLSVESEVRCWQKHLKHTKFSTSSYLSCGQHYKQDVLSLMNTSTCPHVDPDNSTDTSGFNFGIFAPALQSRVIESVTDFPQKFFFCFWWGFCNLSSLGQNLQCSTYVWENVFAIFIALLGLILFSSLIGIMQKYLQSTTLRVEDRRFDKMRFKRRDIERWMSHRMLPDNLKERIRRYEQYKWQQHRGVDEEEIIGSLPKDLRMDVNRHLLILLRRVPMFENFNRQFLDAMCDRLKLVLYTEKSYIVCERDPVDEMLFIVRGNLRTVTTNGGKTGFFNIFELRPGDFCGEELLTWALDPNSPPNLPISTRTVETISEVEAFALMADDLKVVISQFQRTIISKQLQHTFRFYSRQWRTWAACFIQAAWHRYWRKKAEKALLEAEEVQPFGNEDGYTNSSSSSPSFVATVFAQKFAAKALRPIRSGKRSNKVQPPTHRLLRRLPQKPAEPDFTFHNN
ncbi:Cyclic nucleotide-gated ion channel 1, variant 2 [Stylosanthes scabra]|uniref:Cyclic nucleotide-gated ion channel 1, variant 2 n=1 Tax=Stylosanthes scabra TaxID=79078 RepID=A0ABU6RJS9_9FABA|nr:Cyclic nucleotide-gated ion channel 1, variant 2 [Stylosanthes scabra]